MRPNRQLPMPATWVSRRVFSGALLFSPLAISLAVQAQGTAAVGPKAPDFTALDATGKSHKLSAFAGKRVVLEWTNPGCPFVRKHYSGDAAGNMQTLQKEFTAKGVGWLALNSTEQASSDYLAPARLARWMGERKAAPSAVLMDESGKIGQLYGAKTTPHMYIISPAGVLMYAGVIDSIPSARPDDIKTATNYVRQGLNESLAGKPVSLAQSRAYGCSVKYKA